MINEHLKKSIESSLIYIEDFIWMKQCEIPHAKFELSDRAFRATIKILITIMTERFFILVKEESMSLEDAEKMAISMANELRKLIKTYTNIDTHEFYTEKGKLPIH